MIRPMPAYKSTWKIVIMIMARISTQQEVFLYACCVHLQYFTSAFWIPDFHW